MSTVPHTPDTPVAERLPMTLPRLAEKKQLGEPIVMVTAYDYPSAKVAEEAGVDLVLVGDSAAMTVLGYESTVPVSMDEMVMLAAAVRRGLPIAEAGIPVMGHVGLTPQTATALGGYRAQGRTAERALSVARDAVALQEAGCFAIVFEAIPSPLTEAIMPRMRIPVIGIGAGPAADGQVLVFHDLLGIHAGHAARFVKRYANVREAMTKGVAEYAEDVRARRYPEEEHGYTMAPD